MKHEPWIFIIVEYQSRKGGRPARAIVPVERCVQRACLVYRVFQVPGAHCATPRLSHRLHEADQMPDAKDGGTSLKRVIIRNKQDLAWITPKVSLFFSRFNGRVTNVRVLWPENPSNQGP
jgi:hypothetical protein